MKTTINKENKYILEEIYTIYNSKEYEEWCYEYPFLKFHILSIINYTKTENRILSEKIQNIYNSCEYLEFCKENQVPEYHVNVFMEFYK